MKLRNGEDPERCVPPPTTRTTLQLSISQQSGVNTIKFSFLTLCFLAGSGAEHSLTKDALAHAITMTLSVLISDLMSSHMMAWE